MSRPTLPATAEHFRLLVDAVLDCAIYSLDTDGKIADIYGVRMDHMKMDHRVSFLIGLDGKIVHVTDSGNPDVHLAEMKAAIAGLKKP